MVKAKFIERFCGYDYYRDEYGNIYVDINGVVHFCSNLKRGSLTEDKAEPYYTVTDVELVR